MLMLLRLPVIHSAVEEENDEEWGWGDDEGETGGDVELASSFKDDSSVHKRRTSSNESLPTSKTSLMFHKKSPHVSSQAKSHSATEPHTIPKLPKTIPQAPISGSGMSLTAISKPGINRTTPALTPASASVSEFSHLQGMKITTLGPKRNAPATPAKKAPVSAPSPEEDIFASMGLAAKPIFSQAAAPVTSPALMSSRWNVPSVVPVATIATTTATSFGGDDDENWDDDGDLDDLLDD